MSDLETSSSLSLDFKKLRHIADLDLDVIPVVVQHLDTKEVLILAYINEQALTHSQETGYATFWSTSRNTLWEKGATSGDRLQLKEIRVNCEQNSLLFIVLPETTGVCHTKDDAGHHRPTCYYRQVSKTGDLGFVAS